MDAGHVGGCRSGAGCCGVGDTVLLSWRGPG